MANRSPTKDSRPLDTSSARLILDPPGSGNWNMAVDEALLEAAGRGLTTLRLYAWSEPTLSLGYFQAASERDGHAASRDCPLVRRASGGGAIVHDRELTYCLAVPIAQRFGAQADALVSAVHSALIEALAQFKVRATLHAPAAATPSPAAQPLLCFQRRAPGDLLCGEAKIAGSAQRRQRGGLVQHGSVLLAQSPAAPELAGIEQIAGIVVPPADLASRFSGLLGQRLGVVWQAGSLSAEESQRAAAYVQQRFAAPEWTNRR